MFYLEKGSTVRAYQVSEDLFMKENYVVPKWIRRSDRLWFRAYEWEGKLEFGHSMSPFKIGDWIIRDDRDVWFVMPDEEFVEKYSPIEVK